MKIAIFHELPQGGARRAVNEIAKELKKRRHTVDLYIVSEERIKKEKKYFSNVFEFLFTPKLWKGNNWKVRLYKDTIELYRLRSLHKKIAYVIQEKNYDVFFIHGSRFTEAPFILRFLKDAFFYCHDPYYRMIYEKLFSLPKETPVFKKVYESANRLLRKAIDWRNMQASTYLIANSQYTKKEIKRVYERNSVICYLGVDTDFFSPKKSKKDIDILFIGSKTQRVDDYSLLSKALLLIKNIPRVKVIETDKKWVYSDAIIRDYFRRAKITVRLKYNEPFGLTPLEAMACGSIVIAVDEAGYKETISNGKTGILIPRDPQKLADAITLVLSNSRKVKTIYLTARSHVVKSFKWEKTVNMLLKIFKKNNNL